MSGGGRLIQQIKQSISSPLDAGQTPHLIQYTLTKISCGSKLNVLETFVNL